MDLGTSQNLAPEPVQHLHRKDKDRVDEEKHAAQVLEEDREANLGSKDDAIYILHGPRSGRTAGLGGGNMHVPLGIDIHRFLEGKIESDMLALLSIVAPIILGP